MTEPASALASLPSQVVVRAQSTVGTIEHAERLGGMSGGVVRLVGAVGSVVVKADRGGNEAGFYRQSAGMLAQVGVVTPHGHLTERHEDVWWLLLEDVPAPLPRERWLADPAVMAILARLHGAVGSVWSGSFRPSWPSAMTDAALAGTPVATAWRLRKALDRLRREAEQTGLFEPRCPISGDPNPLNWGLRGDGGPVLFDWGRFGLGHPALDLAITVPGLGRMEDFEAVARGYLAVGGPTDLDIERLARAIAVAKAWVLIEFLAGPAYEIDEGARIGASIRGQLEAWLRTILDGADD